MSNQRKKGQPTVTRAGKMQYTNYPPAVGYSGRFNLRITPELHERLVALAAADGGRSLNSLAAAVLAGYVRNATGLPGV
jgi:predicted HicB family RNase H-like nuclease